MDHKGKRRILCGNTIDDKDAVSSVEYQRSCIQCGNGARGRERSAAELLLDGPLAANAEVVVGNLLVGTLYLPC
jgi:hypothetical protein